MSRVLRILAPAFTVCLLWSATSAAASRWEGWYGGIAAGVDKVDVTNRDWNDGTLTNRDIQKRGPALQALVGYHYTRYLSVEVAYTHFADSKFSAFEPNTVSSLWQQGPVFGEARAKGVGVDGVLDWPFFKDRFALLAKGGLFFWTTTMISRPTVAGGTLALGDEQYVHDDGVGWLYGVGAEMRLERRWHIRLEWEHTTVGFEGAFANGRDVNVDFPTLGVTLDF